MLTIDSIRDSVLYQTFMCMSMHTQLTAAQQEIARLEDANKALLSKVAEQEKRILYEQEHPVAALAEELAAIGRGEREQVETAKPPSYTHFGRAPHKDEYLPVGEVIERELS